MALFLSHKGSAIRGFTENEGQKSDAKGADDEKRRERKSASIKFSKARKKFALESRLKRFQYLHSHLLYLNSFVTVNQVSVILLGSEHGFN